MNSIDDKIDKNDSDLQIEILSPDSNYCDLTYKTIVIGDSGVGKSCLTLQAVQNIFENEYRATVGFEFMSFNIRINKVLIKLQIWDTCGQEVYKSLITGLYRNSSLAIIIYSVTNKNSFQHVENWIKELKINSDKNIKTILVGNKCDLVKERKISYEEGENLKKKHKLDYFMEASAKTGNNAKNILIEAAKILYKGYSEIKTNEENNILNDSQSNSQKLDSEKSIKKKKKCC
jgi:Ras-related protein Rab-2A